MTWMKPLKRDEKAVRRKAQLEAAAKEHTPLDFATEPEWQKWIVEHAEYFTTYLRLDRGLILRDEHPTLVKAHKAAQAIAAKHKRTVMIYAVTPDGRDTWVENVKG